MSRKVQKSFIITTNIAERLEQEQNQSHEVREALRSHFGMEVEA